MLGCSGLPLVGVGMAPAAAASAMEGVTSRSAGFVLAAAAACWEPPLLQPADPPALKLPVPGSCPGQTTTLQGIASETCMLMASNYKNMVPYTSLVKLFH